MPTPTEPSDSLRVPLGFFSWVSAQLASTSKLPIITTLIIPRRIPCSSLVEQCSCKTPSLSKHNAWTGTRPTHADAGHGPSACPSWYGRLGLTARRHDDDVH